MQWVPVLWGTLTVIMLIGACAGSTTGGMKCIRMVILAKVSRNEFKHIVHPNAVLPVRVNKQVISPAILSTVLAFLIHLCRHHHCQCTVDAGNGRRFHRIYRDGGFQVSEIWDRDWGAAVRPIHGTDS